MISSRLATLHELDEIYGIEDVYLLLEVITVDAMNEKAANERERS